MKKLLSIPIIMAASLAVALIGSSILLAPSAQARTGQWVTSFPTCGTYTATLDLLSEPNQVDSRVIVTRDDVVVKTQDILGTINDIPGFYHDTEADVAQGVNYKVWIFEKVEGIYVYSPARDDYFSPNIAIGDNGLHDYHRTIVRAENTCTPTPTATATSTPVPPTPTQTLPERCIAAGGIWTASGCAAPTVVPVATSTPIPTVSAPIITPPNTGDAGLK